MESRLPVFGFFFSLAGGFIGARLDTGGSFLAVLGAYAGLKIYHNNSEIRAGGLAFYFGPTIGSIIGFNLFRKPADSVAYSFLEREKNIEIIPAII